MPAGKKTWHPIFWMNVTDSADFFCSLHSFQKQLWLDFFCRKQANICKWHPFMTNSNLTKSYLSQTQSVSWLGIFSINHNLTKPNNVKMLPTIFPLGQLGQSDFKWALCNFIRSICTRLLELSNGCTDKKLLEMKSGSARSWMSNVDRDQEC